MELNLKRWSRDWALMSRFFTADEISTIAAKLKGLSPQNLVFCSFENRFARSGGLAAVTTNILPFLKEVNQVPSVMLMTPFYPAIIDRDRVGPKSASFTVPFRGRTIKAELLEFTWKYDRPRKGSLNEYYLRADGFFEVDSTLQDPYVYDEHDETINNEMLRESALFYCCAVPRALEALGIRQDIVFHLQEWQTALLALTSKEAMIDGILESCGSVQTMHNSYDASIPWSLLKGIEPRKRQRRINQLPGTGMTACEIGLQLVDGPVTTVSDHFALEFTSDILQTEYYAPHLQDIFTKSGVYGVNNGMFVDISREFPKREEHTLQEIQKIKLRNRRALLRVLSTYKPPERFGDLTYRGKAISGLPGNIPIVAMSGRMDPIQKGYYVLLRALEQFEEDEIKAVVTPLTVHQADLDYFYEVACKCRGNLTVFPVRMEKGYHELQTGATFGVMPSIYEPFGAAVEYMASGTVNIGRATGGLMDQIDEECGFLYRESPVFYTLDNVRSFIDSSHIVQLRKTNAWAQSMADNLHEVLRKAVHLYQNDSARYYQLIQRGFQKVHAFSWEQSAQMYFQVYKKIGSL